MLPFLLKLADPGTDLLPGSASSLVSAQTDVSLSPADYSPSAKSDTPPLPAGSPAPSDPAANTCVTSQLQAQPSATCQSQLIIVEQRGQTLPGEHLVGDVSRLAAHLYMLFEITLKSSG